MKHILIPVDFSETSQKALEFAIHFAYPLNAKIILFHSYSPVLVTAKDWGHPSDTRIEDEILFEINQQMDDFITYATKQKVIAQKVIRAGLLKDMINDVAEETQADLIITGMHSPGGLERIVLGTNSMNIFHKAKVPVLIVPELAVYRGIHRIMYATDFRFGDMEELKKICKLAQLFNAHVVAVHVCTNSEETAEDNETMDWLSIVGDRTIQYEYLSYRTVFHEDVLQGLSNEMDSLRTDILCLSSVRKSFWKRAVSKSMIKQIAYHTMVPLLVFHLQE